MAADAEWLAGRAANDDLGFRELRVGAEPGVNAFAAEVAAVRGDAVGIHLKAERFEALGFKSQRQATATREQVEHQRGGFGRRFQQRVDGFDVLHRWRVVCRPQWLSSGASGCMGFCLTQPYASGSPHFLQAGVEVRGVAAVSEPCL